MANKIMTGDIVFSDSSNETFRIWIKSKFFYDDYGYISKNELIINLFNKYCIWNGMDCNSGYYVSWEIKKELLKTVYSIALNTFDSVQVLPELIDQIH